MTVAVGPCLHPVSLPVGARLPQLSMKSKASSVKQVSEKDYIRLVCFCRVFCFPQWPRIGGLGLRKWRSYEDKGEGLS